MTSFKTFLNKFNIKIIFIALIFGFLIESVWILFLMQKERLQNRNQIIKVIQSLIKDPIQQGSYIEVGLRAKVIEGLYGIECIDISISNEIIKKCENSDKNILFTIPGYFINNPNNVNIKFSINDNDLFFKILQRGSAKIIIIILILVFIILSYKNFTNYIQSDLNNLIFKSSNFKNNLHSFFFKEFQVIGDKIIQLQNQKILLQKEQTITNLARQVAHDIRSPLSALNLVIGSMHQLPEEQRVLMRHATQRINDIANGLLSVSKQRSSESSLSLESSDFSSSVLEKMDPTNDKILNTSTEKIMLAPILDQIVSEKRTQLREKINISIDIDLQNSYGIFANINRIEFYRILSNLINNSIDAFSLNKGHIQIELLKNNNLVEILVKDNGQGIPKEVLDKIGQQGFSYGKEQSQNSGNGLGLYHAKSTIEKWGGQLQLSSTLNQGTEVSIHLPIADSPIWFVEQLDVHTNQKIIVCDDDISIHSIWQKRIGHIVSFTSAEELIKWYQTLSDPETSECLFLLDYELLGQTMNGLDLVEELQLKNAVLVTSRYEEPDIWKRCEVIGIKMIPKTMSHFVPILRQT